LTSADTPEERIVTFEETDDGRLVGRIDGDPAPISIGEGAPVKPGEAWVCRLSENDGGYSAMPLRKVEDEYVIDEGPFQDTGSDPESGGSEIQDTDSVRMVLRFPWMRFGDDFVRYEGNDTLRSNLLIRPMYRVYRSLDGNMLQLIPCKEGGTMCVEGMIRINGLDRMVRADIGSRLPYTMDSSVLTMWFD